MSASNIPKDIQDALGRLGERCDDLALAGRGVMEANKTISKRLTELEGGLTLHKETIDKLDDSLTTALQAMNKKWNILDEYSTENRRRVVELVGRIDHYAAKTERLEGEMKFLKIALGVEEDRRTLADIKQATTISTLSDQVIEMATTLVELIEAIKDAQNDLAAGLLEPGEDDGN